MPNIYSIADWSSGTNYKKNNIVKYGSYYYYALTNHSSSTAPSADTINWGGVINNNNETKPYFFWTPSYGYDINIQPKVKTIIFGDGYSQDVKDGINNILLVLDLGFLSRDLDEYSAIIHFLQKREGIESFYFTPPQPFGTLKKFKCKKINPSQKFYNNYDIKVTFEESVN